MNAIANAITPHQEILNLKAKLKATWMSGDYGLFASYMETGAQEFLERLGITPAMRLLDVGCGAGQLAVLAARSGAQVTACDIATNWIEQGRARAAAEGLRITFDEADAESLPYADREFDAVVSLIAAMFAPRPELVARELMRVTRPGGIIAMANWTRSGFVGKMFQIIAAHIAPSGMPAPVLWGDEAVVKDRFGEGISGLNCTRRMYRLAYPFPPDDVVEFFRANYGPMTRTFAGLDANGQRELRNELVELWTKHNRAIGDSTAVDAEYLEVIALRA